jgi:hypothetical protein
MSEVTHDDSVSPNADQEGEWTQIHLISTITGTYPADDFCHLGPYFEAPDINSILQSIRSKNVEIRFKKEPLSSAVPSSAPSIPNHTIINYTYDIVDPLSSTATGKFRECRSQEFVDRETKIEVYFTSSPMWKTEDFDVMAKEEARITVDWTGDKDLDTWTKQDKAGSTLLAAHNPTPIPSLPTAFAPSRFDRESVLYEINVPAVCLGFIHPDDSPLPKEAADLNATITILGDTSTVWEDELTGYVSEPYSPSTAHGETPTPEDVASPSTVRGNTLSPEPAPFNIADFASPGSWYPPSVGTLSDRGGEDYSVGTLSDRDDRNEGELPGKEDDSSDFGEPIEQVKTITKESAGPGTSGRPEPDTHLAPPASDHDSTFDLSDLTDTLLSDDDDLK